MEIKNFKKIRSNLYEIELNNFKKYRLYDDIILKYELLIEKRITEKNLETIVQENNLLDAYYQALKYINIKMRSELEIRTYLKKKSFSIFEADYAVERLREEGYINEEKFIQAFINDSLNLTLNGPRKILTNLKNLGLEENLVNNYLDQIDLNVWKDRVEKIVLKKAWVNKSSSKLFKNKVTSDLINLGYNYDEIRECLEDFKIDTSDVFIKEADKVYNKLSSKYKDNELILRFKQKMFSRGYESDLINDYINKKS